VLNGGKAPAFSAASLAEGTAPALGAFKRTSPYLQQPIFNSYQCEHEMLRCAVQPTPGRRALQLRTARPSARATNMPAWQRQPGPPSAASASCCCSPTHGAAPHPPPRPPPLPPSPRPGTSSAWRTRTCRWRTR
jgi:hypothetical protein